MNVLDLFSGIGGFSLGLERAGMRTVAFCEIDPFCRKILAKRFPDVPVFGDVREFTADQLEFNPDVICGGFPCQDISVAGKGAGITGERSGLWSDYARIIGEVRPRYVIVENVAALLYRGLERVLGDLAALGFDAEWHCIPASAVGAPHRRDRVWIIAYGDGGRQSQLEECNGRSLAGEQPSLGHDTVGLRDDVAHASGAIMEGPWLAQRISEERNSACRASWWQSEPDVGRVAHGVPARVDRLRALGNAIVPQIAEIIGRAIMSAERDEYDADDDLSESIKLGFRAIRERMANGGPGWTPK